MVKESAVIKCESQFNKNKEHRYSTKRIWDDKKPLVTVISIAPSEDYNVSVDLTTQILQNNLNQLQYGGFTLTNLFSKIGIDFKGMTDTAGTYDKDTDKVIVSSCEEVETIIIAWGKMTSKSKVINKRVDEVLALLLPFTDKVHYLVDKMGRAELHPLTPSLRHAFFLIKADNVTPAVSE